MRAPETFFWLVAALTFLPFSGDAHGDQTAINFDSTKPWSGVAGTGVFGWQFSTTSDIRVTRLGLYDYPNYFIGPGFIGDGLTAAHTIGIWATSAPAVLLTSATVPSADNATLVNGFRYVDISPVNLPGGKEYVIGALYEFIPGIQEDFAVGEFNNFNPVFEMTVGGSLIFGGRRYIASPPDSLVYPEFLELGVASDFGPNFTYTVVPEPSLLVFGSAGLFALRALTKGRSRRLHYDERLDASNPRC